MKIVPTLTHPKRASLFACMPLFLSSAVFASEPGTFDRTLAVSGPVSIDISSGPGGITITTGTCRSVVIHAVIRATFGRADLGLAEANIQALEQNPPVEQNGNTIRVGYVKDDTILKGVSVTYDIQTPPQTQVHAAATAGGIRIDGVQGPVEITNGAGRSEVDGVKGEVKIATQSGGIFVRNAGSGVLLRNESGGIQVEGARGPVQAETKSGRIELSGISGEVHATTQSASIRLHDITGAVTAVNHSGSIESFGSGGSISAETASGSIRLSQTITAPIHALSQSGAIHIELAASRGYDLSLHSEKGKLSASSIPAIPKTKDQHSLVTQINGGGPAVEVQTRSSKIEIQ